jgi:2-(1,2-epoxy-1,2-dihydrophenyl)acetyl-CoA isomerase
MPRQSHFQGFDVDIRVDGVAVITFTNPARLNAMTSATRRELSEFLRLAELHDDIRVIVLTATGRGFTAGVYNARSDETPTLVPPVPVPAYVPINVYSRLVTYAQEPVRTLRRLNKLTIAAVNGYAIQLGLSMALACDYLIVAQSARLGSATLRMGWQPDEGGHWLLVEQLGVKRALDFVMRNRIVTGEEAVELGLATEVVADEDLMDRALALGAELAAGPQVAMRMLKRAVYNAAQLTFDQAGEDLAARAVVSDFHQDAKDGASAFFEKRQPEFNKWLEGDVEPDEGSPGW